MKYIDLHCDTLMQAFIQGKQDLSALNGTMLTLDKLKQGGACAQFFAIFMPPLSSRTQFPQLPDDDRYIEILSGILAQTAQNHPTDLFRACGGDDLSACREPGAVAAYLTLEDGRPVQGRLEKLDTYARMGIRLITLTWNEANCFGSPNSNDPAVMNTGLTPFGREAIPHMEELGILVDVSHLSDGGFWDVVRLSRKPFVASHSSCRALCPHPRNLTDDMIRAVADCGGVVGINFGPAFISPDPNHPVSTLEGIAAHIRHAVNVGGIGCVALGSDFDGVTGQMEIDGPDKIPLLLQQLHKEGFSTWECEQIAWKNTQRVIQSMSESRP